MYAERGRGIGRREGEKEGKGGAETFAAAGWMEETHRYCLYSKQACVTRIGQSMIKTKVALYQNKHSDCYDLIG